MRANKILIIYLAYSFIHLNLLYSNGLELFQYAYNEGWGEPIRISDGKGSAECPSIFKYNNDIHLVWQDNRTGKYQIYYKKGKDSGEEWSISKNISKSIEDAIHPSIAVFKNYINIVWEDYTSKNPQIYLKHSDNYGVNWQATQKITKSEDNEMFPAIIMNGKYAGIVWVNDSKVNYHICFKKSEDYGKKWYLKSFLTDGEYDNFYPQILFDNEFKIYWKGETDNGERLYFIESLGKGTSWIPKIEITKENILSAPKAKIYKDKIYITWIGKKYNRLYLFLLAGDKLKRFRLNLNADDFEFEKFYNMSDVLVNEDGIHLFWCDGQNGKTDIYYSFYNNKKKIWTKPFNLTKNNNSLFPVVSGDDNTILLFYQKREKDFFQIYYKRKITQREIEYSVKLGDSLIKLCEKFYNSSDYYLALALYNNLTHLEMDNFSRIYKSIKIPPTNVLEKLKQTQKYKALKANYYHIKNWLTEGYLLSLGLVYKEVKFILDKELYTFYDINKGETWWSISQKIYGTPKYYKKIAYFNGKSIDEPIKERTRIVILRLKK